MVIGDDHSIPMRPASLQRAKAVMPQSTVMTSVAPVPSAHEKADGGP